MKKYTTHIISEGIILLLLFLNFYSCNNSTETIKKNRKYKAELIPYVDYLNKNHQSAKNYVLDLFKNNDLVIICERDHRENTQYELIKELISDPRFIENVGNIFTEVGMRNLNPELNNFIHSNNIPNKIKERKIIEFQRRCSFYPLWDKYNFYYFINTLYNINQKLKSSKKINLYPTDVPLDLDSLDVSYLKKFWYNEIANRDSLMANYIIKNFEKIKKSNTKRNKALIIMNFRHSFNNKFKRPDGRSFDNVGRFLFDKYPNKIANVLINPLNILEAKSDFDITWSAIQDGKWDAAFKACNKDNIGFDFKGTPFGNDHFDYWSFTPHKYNYKDIFTGFVYFKQPDEFKLITGVSGLIDSTFTKTYKKRVNLWKEIVGDRLNSLMIDSIIDKKYNHQNIAKKEKIDSIELQINKWLK